MGYENSKDVIFEFYGDHYWFMGKLELVAKDNSTLWEHLKSRHHLKKTMMDRMLPKSLLKHTKTNNHKEFKYFKNPYSHEISTYAYYLPAEGLVYITWLGDW